MIISYYFLLTPFIEILSIYFLINFLTYYNINFMYIFVFIQLLQNNMIYDILMKSFIQT